MKEIGLVVDIEDFNALVKIDRKTACENCKGCGFGTQDGKSIIVHAVNQANALKGDTVELDMDTPNVLTAAFLIYTIPLIALMFGILSSYGVMKIIGHQSEALSFIFGIICLGLSFLLIKKNEDKIKKSQKFNPVVVSIKGKALL